MKRILTAVVLVPVVVFVALAAPQWLFLAALSAVALVCFHEYDKIVAAHGILSAGPAAYAAGLVLLLAPRADLPLVTVLALILLTLGMHLDDLAKGLPRAAAAMLGVIYIFGAWRCGALLRAISPHWLIFGMAVNWVGDMAAYYVGSTMGRHRLAPRVSPKKSWEGAAGSVVAGVLFGVAYLRWAIPSVPMWEAAALATAVNVAGQIGDLAESAIKRGAGVKDSSNLLPGHGGWLDRVDSTLFGLPALYFLLARPW
ncbi:MAG: phosphatidate cytidylyltransferase [Bryobacterales bacterium]|nr:phosphatidate cytidylyltransferase [Bryobacterales bacterium]